MGPILHTKSNGPTGEVRITPNPYPHKFLYMDVLSFLVWLNRIFDTNSLKKISNLKPYKKRALKAEIDFFNFPFFA